MSAARVAAHPPSEDVLIVDDEADVQGLLAFNLAEAGFRPHIVSSGAAAVALAPRLRPAVIVLDWMLPDMDGPDVCARLRESAALGDASILILTARGAEEDRVRGLERGADDFVTKPFSVRELVLRIRLLARLATDRKSARAGSESRAPIRWRGLEVDPAHHRAYVEGVEVNLRPLEFKLLSVLLGNPTRRFSRHELVAEVWGLTVPTKSRVVDTQVRRVREKLGSHGIAIETLHGHGYRLRIESE